MLRVINYAAKMIHGLRKYDHASQCRNNLKWLDAKTELAYRTVLVSYKLFVERNTIGNFTLNECRRSARLNQMPKFVLPPFKTDIAKRAFSYRAPFLLNDICEKCNIDCSIPISYSKFKQLVNIFYDI